MQQYRSGWQARIKPLWAEMDKEKCLPDGSLDKNKVIVPLVKGRPQTVCNIDTWTTLHLTNFQQRYLNGRLQLATARDSCTVKRHHQNLFGTSAKPSGIQPVIETQICSSLFDWEPPTVPQERANNHSRSDSGSPIHLTCMSPVSKG